ncbi:CARDB domain-containing protein [Haloferax sp. YSMS24]|uniref:CARDB domain-containing protein n=1 Tax=unclassified Haloferax TaxID=2625095 RepID=UPI00398C9B3B
MSRRALPVVLLLVVVLAGVPATTVGQEATAYIDDVTVSPAQPVPGERFVLTTVVQNAQNSPTNLDVTDVYVRTAEGTRDLARVEDLGTIPPGSDLRIPLSLRLEDAGTYDLRVNVVGKSDGQTQRLQYPVVVRVREGGPQVAVEVGDAVIGTETPVTVTVSNGEDEVARNVRLSVAADGATVENDARVLPRLEPGQAETFNFSVTPSTGESEVVASLQYTTADGNARTTTAAAPLVADQLREEVRLDASLGDGARPAVVVDVTNLGNAPLDDFVLSLRDGDSVVLSKPVESVPAESERTVRLNVSSVDRATLDVVATYETGDRDGTASTTIDYVASPGTIELTGIDVELEDGAVHISGSASNVGLSDAQSVVVRVVPTDGVEPTRPYKEYFVGSVPASDFASFDLYANVDEGVTSVPVEVSYLVDGRERTVETTVDVSDLSTPDEQNSGGGIDSTLLLGGGAIALLVVVGVSIYAYRRR